MLKLQRQLLTAAIIVKLLMESELIKYAHRPGDDADVPTGQFSA